MKLIYLPAMAFFVFVGLYSMDRRDETDEYAASAPREDEAPAGHAGPAAAARPEMPKHLTEAAKTASGSVQVPMQLIRMNTVSLGRYYNRETKTLNLSNMPIGDKPLALMLSFIKHFVEERSVETLLLENMELTQIPSDLLLFSLTNRSLKLVSFRDNKFTIGGRPLSPLASSADAARPADDVQQGGRVEIAIDKMEDPSDFMATFSSLFGEGAAGRRGSVVAVADLAKAAWDAIYPGLEQEIQKQSSGEGMQLYSKVILFDRNIPPFVFTNAKQKKPVTSWSRAKYILARMVFMAAGILVYAGPTLLYQYLSASSDGCDEQALVDMMDACGVSGR